MNHIMSVLYPELANNPKSSCGWQGLHVADEAHVIYLALVPTHLHLTSQTSFPALPPPLLTLL